MDHSTHRELVDGSQTGSAADLARMGLSTMSFFYGLGVFARNGLYGGRWLPVHRAAVPVVSVGNITAGGTGKTPLVAYLARWFAAKGLSPAILSRGYRAEQHSSNDEWRVLQQLCPNVLHLQDPDRRRSAEIACREHRAGVLILDDGFQHRRLHRDLNLLLIDALDPWGGGRLLPRGFLRESLREMRRADLVLITRADQCSPDAASQIRADLCRIRGTGECVEVAFRPEALIDWEGHASPLESLAGKKVAAFCGIGNPAGFRRTLVDLGCAVGEENLRGFADHHHYRDRDLRQIAEWARTIGADVLLTTQKDLVKIPHSSIEGLPLLAIRIQASLGEGGHLLEQRLEAISQLCQSSLRSQSIVN